MQTAVPLACFLSIIRPPGVQYENSLLQIAPVDKSKCPYVKDGNDVAFQLFTRHNPTVFQDLKVDDDEKLFASNMDFHDKTVLYFHAWMETPEDGSAVMVREAYMQRGDTNVIMVDARSLQAGPWYFTAAQNTWYIGRFAGHFIDYLVTRGLNLNNTHLVGHSLGAHVAGVAGSALKSGKVARITGLDAALPLFENLPLQQRLDSSDAKFVDIIHTDSGIFGYKAPIGHVDFYPNAGISPQPGCELEVVIPQQLLLNKCDARTQTNGFYTYYLKGKQESTFRRNSLEYKLEKLFAFIQAVRDKSVKKDGEVTLDKVKANIISLYDFKDGVIDYLNDYDEEYNDTEIGSNIDDKINKKVKENNYDEGKINKQTKNNSNDDENTKMSTADDEDVKTDDVVNVETIEDNNKQIDKTLGDEVLEDQIAEESDINRANTGQNNIKINATLEDAFEIKTRKKRDADLSDNKTDKELTVTVLSGNLTLVKNELNNTESNITKYFEKTKTNVESENNTTDTSTINPEVDATTTISTEEFEILLDDGDEGFKDTTKVNKPESFNLFRRRPILRQIIRSIPRINSKKRSNNKKSMFAAFKNRVSDKRVFNPIKIGSKFNTNSKFKKILKRQKRFLPFFQRAEDSNSILFRMLDFLVKNRKNVLPVFTVMREINTLVKSANGELNHITKENNNYIGATPPVFTPITYNLELGNENRMTAFVKRILGIVPKGDRLTIGTGK